MTEASTDRRWALSLLVGAAAAWSGLCVALWWAGHAPSGPTPIDGWYGLQAALVWLVVPLQGLVAGRVAARVAGTRPLGTWAASVGLGAAVLLFVVSDWIAWAAVGFDGLGAVLRVTAPVSLGLGVGVGTWRLRAVGAPAGRALLGVLTGFFVAAVVGGPFLR